MTNEEIKLFEVGHRCNLTSQGGPGGAVDGDRTDNRDYTEEFYFKPYHTSLW